MLNISNEVGSVDDVVWAEVGEAVRDDEVGDVVCRTILEAVVVVVWVVGVVEVSFL